MLATDPVASYTVALRNLAAAKNHLQECLSALEAASTPQVLAEALLEYQRLRQEVEAGWQCIPEEQRRVLQPPAHYD